MFSCEFCKIFKKLFSCTPPEDCFCFIHVQVAEFQPADTVKNYFSGAFQAFYTRTWSSHSKAFIYLKSLNFICENEVARCQPASLRKFFFHISSFVYFAFIFPERITIASISFRKYTIHLSHFSSCWIWHLTLSWVRFCQINCGWRSTCLICCHVQHKNNTNSTNLVCYWLGQNLD